MKYTVYKVTNLLDGKYYIGKHQTEDLNDGYMGSGKRIVRTIKKHGLENFKKEILHVFETEEEMNAKEAELVVISEDTYNLCPGGKGGWGYVNEFVISLETRRKTGSKNIKKIHELGLHKNARTIEQRLAVSKRMKGKRLFLGKKHSEEVKIQISRNRKDIGSGSNNSQYGTFWITNGYENQKTKDYIPQGWYKGRTFLKDRHGLEKI